MPRLSIYWKIFLFVQLFAVVSWAICGFIKSELGIFFWSTQFIVFSPGYFFLAEHIENVFWNKGLSLTAIGALVTAGNIILNAIIWFLIGRIFNLALKLKHKVILK